uniref:p7 n=1 Tax=Potato yellow vein virus TaxID=103881 RepID=A0A3B8DMN2_9CLOS|nr:p7 [Potato yellow vein virus]
MNSLCRIIFEVNKNFCVYFLSNNIDFLGDELTYLDPSIEDLRDLLRDHFYIRKVW